MRGAFVVQLGPDTDPSQDRFEGQVEEVDSGKELRFRSGKELLDFLGLRFNAALCSAEERTSGGSSQTLLHDEEF